MPKEWAIGEVPMTPDEWWDKYRNEIDVLKAQKTEFDAGIHAGFALGVLAMTEAGMIIRSHPSGKIFSKQLTTRINGIFKEAHLPKS
jgi:hypothetical protein